MVLIFLAAIFFGMTEQAIAQVSTLTYDLSGNLSNITQTAASGPGISVQPANLVVAENSDAYFSVTPSGPGPFFYQWLSNGIAITGATNDLLTVPGVIVPTNLVNDGGFEIPPIVLVTSQTFSAGTNVGGWMVDTGSVNVTRFSWQPEEEEQSLDLNGSGAGSIYQDLATVPGQNYNLHFAFAGVPGAPALKTNQVWWNGTLLDTIIFNTTGHSVTAMGWTNGEYTVGATTTSTRLRFTSLTTGASGPALDAVSVTPILPVPTAYSVIVSNFSGSVTSTVASVQFDTDNNGLPDAWELAYFGAIGQDPNADSDGDGVSNLNEYLDGTNPEDASSFRPRLHLSGTPGGSFSVSPLQASYTLGQAVQISAFPSSGFFFLNWTGSITNTNATVNVVMDGHKTIAAIFGQVLTNGQLFTDSLLPGGTNIYGFFANAGDSFILQIGTISADSNPFYPQIFISNPYGFNLASGASVSGEYVIATATNTGPYTVMIKSYYPAGSGSYRLNLAKAPGSYTVSPGDEGGILTNGLNYIGALPAGDLDMWSFDANAGDGIILQMGALVKSNANFYPQIFLYSPNGTLQARVDDSQGIYLSTRATNSGTFTVVVNSYYDGNAGTYLLNLAKSPGPSFVSPGDEGGPLTNGATYLGTLPVGDLDTWNFNANAGDSIMLQMGALVRSNAGFYPQIFLYDPYGNLQARVSDSQGTFLQTRATNSGTFSVVVNSYYDYGAGTYSLNLAKAPGTFVVSPGDEGGTLSNGVMNSGVLPTGDMDMWSFSANSGDNITLRMGALVKSNTTFYPQITLFGPDGGMLSQGANSSDAYVNVRATNSGTFTVVANSYYDDGAGVYQLNLSKAPGAFAVSPGDEGGALTNGGNFDGVTTLADEDMWSFTANKGDYIILRSGDTSPVGSYAPWIRLYGPDGAPLANNANSLDSYVGYQTTNSGTFTVLVGAYFQGYTGSYQLRFLQIPGVFIVPPGDDGGVISNATSYPGTTDLGDEDPWTFTAFKGAPINLNCQKLSGAASYQPWMRLFNPNGGLVANTASGTTGVINYTPTNSGTFTVVVGSYFQGYTGTYQLTGTNFSSGLILHSPSISGTNFSLTASGGVSNVLSVLLSTTNLNQPWTPVWTNRFDGSNMVIYSNMWNAGQPQQFFKLTVP